MPRIDATTAKHALVLTTVIVAFVLLAALVGCGQSKPTGSEFLGKWEVTIMEGPCHLDISRLGENFVIKSERQITGNCEAFEGVYTLTPEGNLKKGGDLMTVLISFDKTNNRAVVSGLDRLRYMTRAQ
jgi:hypothetical protein